MDVYFQKINLIILPNRDDFALNKIVKEKTLYVGKRWNLREVRDRVLKILSLPKYGFNLEDTKVRVWKLDPYENYEKILSKLEEHVNRIKTFTVNNNEQDVDTNSGIEFPGTCLELYDKTRPFEKLNVGNTDKVVLELANSKGEFIFKYYKNMKIGKCEFCLDEKPILVSCKCNQVHYCSESCRRKDEHFHSDRCTAFDINEDLSAFKKSEKSNMGLTGLQSLGNTCFMNSGLQCLSNTWELSKFFLEDVYTKEVNTENKLGLQGKMAVSYAKLMKLLWYNDQSFVSPWDVKRVAGKFQSTFMGNAQQDSQELISTILDALHEDLNRVHAKPYVELKSTSDPNDNSISAESWYNHLARNQSIIVDLMHGQFKSLVQCPRCTRYSITFDPFSVLSVPLPSESKIAISFIFVPYDLSKKSMKCAVSANKNDTVDAFRVQVAQLLGIHKDSMMLVTLSANTFDRFICRDRLTKLLPKLQTGASKLYLLEIDPRVFNGPENITVEKKKKLQEEKNKEAEERVKMLKEEEESKGIQRNRLHEEEKAPDYSNNYQTVAKKEKDKGRDHDDYNNGFDDCMLRVSLHIQKMAKGSFYSGSYKERKTFTRLLYVKTSDSLKTLHHEIFHYFRPLFEKALKNQATPENDEILIKRMPDEELFKKVFPDLDEGNWEDKLKSSNTYPYDLRFMNIAEKSYFKKEKCFYCDSDSCDNCPVPYSSSLKIIDMIKKMNEKGDIKNDYFYYEHQYYNANRKEFEFEVVFNEDTQKCLIDFASLEDTEVHKDFGTTITGKGSGVSIYDCLNLFSQWETLDKDNQWYCSKCQDSVQANKKMEIFRCPPILILHLKRFRVRESGITVSNSSRMNRYVDYPIEGLDMSPYCKGTSGSAIYDLYAVSNHYGSIGFGHYTAFAKNKNANSWYKFDDSSVSPILTSEICSSASYVLFYRRRDIGEEIDFEKLKQKIPADYKIPEIVSKNPAKTLPKVEEEEKSKSNKENAIKEEKKQEQPEHIPSENPNTMDGFIKGSINDTEQRS